MSQSFCRRSAKDGSDRATRRGDGEIYKADQYIWDDHQSDKKLKHRTIKNIHVHVGGSVHVDKGGLPRPFSGYDAEATAGIRTAGHQMSGG